LLIAPTRTEVIRGKRAILTLFDDGQVHYDTTLLDAASDALGEPRGMQRIEIRFAEPPDPATIEETTPAVGYLRTRVAGMFAVAELAAESIIMPALQPSTARDGSYTEWAGQHDLSVGIEHPGGAFGVKVSIPRPVLATAYLRPSGGESWYRDPDLFLSDLSSLGLDERAVRALGESLRAYGRGLYLAAASLLGVVSEAAWFAAAERLGKPGGLEEAVRTEREGPVPCSRHPA